MPDFTTLYNMYVIMLTLFIVYSALFMSNASCLFSRHPRGG